MARGLVRWAACSALVAFALALSGAAHAQAAPGPNILVIVTDDQRGGFSVMPFARHWFGARGIRYSQAFANTPVCCPARASIMTGRYAHNHGVLDNLSALQLDQDTTIQARLHDVGYRTALIGKFLNQWELTIAPPHFDAWAMVSNRLNGDLFSNDFFSGGLWNVDGTLRQVDTYSTRFIGGRAVAFLKQQESTDDVPWLLFVATPAPHLPAPAEPKYADAHVPNWGGNPATAETDLSDKPPWWQRRAISFKRGRELQAMQYRALMSVDDLVERIAANLDTLGETRSTLAFFVSDNGFLWSEHGLKAKSFPYEGSVKVPMFMRWPGHVSAGDTDTRLVALIDIAPTIAAAAGLSPNPSPPMDGRSLLDFSWDRTRLLLEYFPFPNSTTPAWASTRTRDAQYTEYYTENTGEVSFREFYDLIADRWQLDNLYNDADRGNDPSPASTAEISRTLARDRLCVGNTCP